MDNVTIQDDPAITQHATAILMICAEEFGLLLETGGTTKAANAERRIAEHIREFVVPETIGKSAFDSAGRVLGLTAVQSYMRRSKAWAFGLGALWASLCFWIVR
jgi:hypothetical protein